MRYSEVRDRIAIGDVLGIRGHGAFPRVTHAVQHLGGLYQVGWAFEAGLKVV